MAKAEGKAGSPFFSPHIHSRFSIESMMWDTVIALLPAGAAAIIFFGMNSVRIILISLLTGILTELLMNILSKRGFTAFDGSAVITSLLFAYCLPPGIPWFVVIAGCFFAIAIVKWAFGGLGKNFMNPALGGRIFVAAVWPVLFIGKWSPSMLDLIVKGISFKEASRIIIGPDAVSSASPLSLLKTGGWESVHNMNIDNYFNLFIGNRPGCIGETSVIALLIGFIYLLFRKVINPVIPVTYTAVTVLLVWVFGGLPYRTGFFTGNALFHIITGGFILGSLFMASDPVTTPISLYGKIIFGIFLGILTVAIRLWSIFPDGVCYAIIIMNIFVPVIDKFTREKIYGYGKRASIKSRIVK